MDIYLYICMHIWIYRSTIQQVNYINELLLGDTLCIFVCILPCSTEKSRTDTKGEAQKVNSDDERDVNITFSQISNEPSSHLRLNPCEDRTYVRLYSVKHIWSLDLSF